MYWQKAGLGQMMIKVINDVLYIILYLINVEV